MGFPLRCPTCQTKSGFTSRTNALWPANMFLSTRAARCILIASHPCRTCDSHDRCRHDAAAPCIVRVHLDTGRENVVVISRRSKALRPEIFRGFSRVELRCNSKTLLATLLITDDDALVGPGGIGLSEPAFGASASRKEAWSRLRRRRLPTASRQSAARSRAGS